MSSWTIGTRCASQQRARSVIPHDPGFEILPNNPLSPHGSMSSRVDYFPAGRVRPEAREIASHHHSGTVGVLFQAEPRQFVPRKPAKKDYFKQNYRRVREIERFTQSRLEPPIEKQQPVIKSALKYRETPSRLGAVTRPSSTSTARPLTPSQKNYISLNNKQAADFRLKRPPSAEKIRAVEEKLDQNLRAYKRGSIPSYLRKRQEEWHQHEVERISKIPDPECPPGHVAMAETERMETMNLLTKSKNELLEDLKSMPMCTDTLKGMQKKSLLENKLAEIDDAIKIFSRRKVYVKQD
ncbi:Enkurin domain-containing protein 1 [Oopsacas minuta]|uniref:Enkurin domain-containing protein 1 n=1 Tax=Oopsacas minuta TaxID=111878 RepID=A0AAV7K0M3_9METZ|nr:Enkurin domain-containing protein 1 [Oopsacas minuta]